MLINFFIIKDFLFLNPIMKKLLLFTLIIAFISCKNETKKTVEPIIEKSIESIEIIDYSGLDKLLNKNDNKTYVVNFWATWCKPCVEELPAFEKLFNKYKNQNVELILVSLDFSKQLEKRVIPFIKQNNLQGKVVLMDDPDQNTWIPKVNEKWSGAIPATVIYNKKNRKFYEQSFTYNELETELLKILKTN